MLIKLYFSVFDSILAQSYYKKHNSKHRISS